jgi:nucleoid-associated protein YgaU
MMCTGFHDGAALARHPDPWEQCCTMGIFDFVKDVGTKLFGDDEAEKKAAEEAAAAQAAGAEAARIAKEARDKAIAEALVGIVQGLELKIEELDIQFDHDLATVRGTTRSQSEREKVILAIGNSQGVGRVDDQIEVRPVFHVVEKGDTLSKIAEKHYGDKMKYNAIFEANKPMLKSPDLIYPGQSLRIPEL